MRTRFWTIVWLLAGSVEHMPAQSPSAPLPPPTQADIPQPSAQPWFPQAPPLPVPQGEGLRGATVGELAAAVARIKPGGTVLIADGHHRRPRCL